MAFRFGVSKGDIVDLSGAEISSKNGHEHLLCVIRDASSANSLSLIADKKYADLIIARITEITHVDHVIHKGRDNKWRHFTDVFVELENAYGEEPVLVAKNKAGNAFATNRPSTRFSGTWRRPEFGGSE